MDKLSVQELRQSLREKGVDARGSRKQLVQRLKELYESRPAAEEQPAVKYRITLIDMQSNKATILLLPPSPGHRLLSSILQRAANKFRIRAKRVFVAGSGLEVDVDSVGEVVRDGVKLVISTGAKYEMVSGTGSPEISGMTGETDSPVQPIRDGDAEGDEELQSEVASVTDEVKLDALDISDTSSLTGSFDDGKSEEGDGRTLFTPLAAPIDRSPALVAGSPHSLLSSLTSIPNWLIGRTAGTQNAASNSLTPSHSIPIPAASPIATPATARSRAAEREEKLPNSPSPSYSSSSSNSPSLFSSSPTPTSTTAHFPALSSSSPSTPLPPATASPSSSPQPSDDSSHGALLSENARLRESIRSLEGKRKDVRRMEAQLKQLTRDEEEWKVERARLRALEGGAREWQDKYVDSEERLLLATRANEKAVREREQLKAKHAAVVERLNKAQGLKAEMDGMGKELRDVREEMAVFRGKDMEEKPLPMLQELLSFHQQMVVRIHSVVTARIDGERKAMQEKWMCKVCFEKEVSILLQPCNHCVTCGRCSSLITCCPICRRTINIRSPMYLS